MKSQLTSSQTSIWSRADFERTFQEGRQKADDNKRLLTRIASTLTLVFYLYLLLHATAATDIAATEIGLFRPLIDNAVLYALAGLLVIVTIPMSLSFVGNNHGRNFSVGERILRDAYDEWGVITQRQPPVVFLFFRKTTVDFMARYHFPDSSVSAESKIHDQRVILYLGLSLAFIAVTLATFIPNDHLWPVAIVAPAYLIFAGFLMDILIATYTNYLNRGMGTPAGLGWSMRFLVPFLPIAASRQFGPGFGVALFSIVILLMSYDWLFHTFWFNSRFVKYEDYSD